MKPLKRENKDTLHCEGDDGEYTENYHGPRSDGHRETGTTLRTRRQYFAHSHPSWPDFNYNASPDLSTGQRKAGISLTNPNVDMI